MNSFFAFLVFALAAVAMVGAEAGYNYQRNGAGSSFSGGSSFGGSFGGGSSFGGGGGGYQAVSGGFQTSEGQNVDPQLLEQVRQILLNEEGKSGGSGGNGGGGFGGAPSGSYGPPSSSYGAPNVGGGGRVVGIDLEGVRQAIQVAQFAQQSTQAGGGGGYPAATSGSYSAPSRPSSNYGAPF